MNENIVDNSFIYLYLNSLKHVQVTPECYNHAAGTTRWMYIVIIIMTRRQLRSVAATPHDVHVHLHSATSVSSWPVFRCRSAVSRFFEDAQEVFSNSSPDSARLSLQ